MINLANVVALLRILCFLSFLFSFSASICKPHCLPGLHHSKQRIGNVIVVIYMQKESVYGYVPFLFSPLPLLNAVEWVVSILLKVDSQKYGLNLFFSTSSGISVLPCKIKGWKLGDNNFQPLNVLPYIWDTVLTSSRVLSPDKSNAQIYGKTQQKLA